MLTRRLTLAVIATAFAASSSLAMLQNADPAAAHPHEHWRHHEHHQRFNRDDRAHERQVYLGSWHRHHRYANQWYANRAYVNNGSVYNGYNGSVYNGYNGYVYNGNVYNSYGTPVYYTPGYANTATYYPPRYQQYRYANRAPRPHDAWVRPHHDRDDRHWRGPGKPHIDPWRDHR